MKNNKFLSIFILIILILLILILFVLPDSFFLSIYNKKDIEIKPSNTQTKIEFTSYEKQINTLKENKYEYKYLILDSMSDKTYQYSCTGTKDGNIESGTCTSPEKVSYTEKDKKEVFANINTDYLDVDYIFSLIKDKTPAENSFSKTREYTYITYIKDLETEIVITTDLKNITKILISNAYMTYLLNYTI